MLFSYQRAPSAKKIFGISLWIAIWLNIVFYLAWELFGAVFVCLVLFPKKVWEIVRRVKNLLAIVAGMLLGMIHYVIYNLFNGFPTFQTLWLSIFNTEKYNENAIDNKQLGGLFDEVLIRFGYLKAYAWIGVMGCILLMTAAAVILIIWACYKKRWPEIRYFIASMLWLYAVAGAILISPNTTRAGHYIYLIFPFTAALVSLCIWIKKRVSPKVACALLVTVAAGCMAHSTYRVCVANDNKGTGYFTPAIFELTDYTADHDMDDDVFFVEWGFHAQYYFMHKGDFTIREMVWRLQDVDSSQEAEELSEEYLSWMLEEKDVCYFPCYLKKDGSIQSEDVALFIESAEACGFEVTPEKDFYETNGARPIIRLYQVTRGE